MHSTRQSAVSDSRRPPASSAPNRPRGGTDRFGPAGDRAREQFRDQAHSRPRPRRLGLGAGFQTSEAFNHFIWTGTPFASPAFIAPAFFAQFFCQDLNPNLAATLNAEQIALNFSIALTPSGPVAWHTLPAWYALSGKDLMIDPAEGLFMAQRAGATTIVFPAASHAGGFTHYATGFVKLIEEAVQETAD